MKILFMCVANAARSQMAEGLARHLFANHIEVQSAGSQPKTVHPLAKLALAEIGIDISSHHSKSCDQLSVEFGNDLDYLVTLCAEEVCPVTSFKTAKKVHWPLPDPASETATEDQQMDAFRKTRDEIKKRIEAFALEFRL